jgi:cbb3-type cytochrome c oxidase subunit I
MFKTILSDEPGSATRRFFYSAIFWLIIPVFIGLFTATLLYAPFVQEYVPAALKAVLNFGRLRPAHTTVAIFGWLSMAYAGAILFLTPRLTGTTLYSERLANFTLILWNVLMVGALISFPLGYTQGREYAEMVWPLDILFLVIFTLLCINVWQTVARRTEKSIYISVWSFMIGPLLLIPIYAVGNKVWPLYLVNGQLALDFSGAYYGMNDNIINYFYVHNLFNAWFTTVGTGLAYYLIPKLTGKPLYSHRLAIWGFWSVWTGQHHQLFSPSPYWLQTLTVIFSILAAIPTSLFMFNFFMTMRGKWSLAVSDVRLRWVVVGAIFWGLTCVQGVAQSFPTFSLLTHFTNWVVGHSHLAFIGDYSFWMFATIYLLLPVVTGRKIFSRALAEWHFWLTFIGLVTFMMSLWVAGLIQGQNWLTGTPFIETVRSMNIYFFFRLAGGALMVIGQCVFAYNIYRTATSPLPVAVTQPAYTPQPALGGD